MERLALEFALRAALIAATTAMLLFLLRIRSAAAQHAAWTAVLAAMLALPPWIAWGPKATVPVLRPGRWALAETSVPGSVSVPPGPAAPPVAAPVPVRAAWTWQSVALLVYTLGSLTLLLRLAIGTVRARRLTSASCVAPIAAGLFRPRVILPETACAWAPAQLEAVLAHENAHVRRRDPLVQWLALLNRALFWFHPLAWWLERRLAALAEDACDAEVLARGHDPAEYSSYLVELARSVQEAGTRLDVAGMAMPGSNLPVRIARMLSGRVAPRVSRAQLALSVAVSAVSVAAVAAVGFEPAPQEFPRIPAVRPKFEVASIRPCRQGDVTEGGGKKGGRGGGRVRVSPRTLVAECRTVDELIRMAYLDHPDGKPWPAVPGIGIPQPPVSRRVRQQEIKAPAWVGSDRYTIEATAEGASADEMMRGPMLQMLLEERFHLRVRVEERDTPVYILSVASGGPKLEAAKEGSCISLIEFEERYSGPRQPGQQIPRVCGPFRPAILDRNPNVDRAVADRSIGLVTYGQTMAALSVQFSVSTDRDVLDRTGLTGKYDMQLDLASQDLFPAPPTDAAAEPPPTPAEKLAHIIAALRKLGLKLEAGKAPAPFLVIERVERPTEN